MNAHETARVIFFAGLFVAFALWESLRPRRARALSRWVRWVSNLGLVAINTALLPLVAPVMAVGMAAIARDHGFGAFNQIAVPTWLAFGLTVVLLDLVVYLQHVLFHAVPVLWRLHRVHHSDVELDVSSGVRFHFLEILISLFIKLSAISLLGPPVAAVVVFEILLNGTAMFNHANIRLPAGADRVLRWFLVTPDMHRVHHSTDVRELNRNFGFNLPWWDFLCGTYTAQPAAGHEHMQIGVDRFREPGDQRLDRLLVQPLQPAGPAGKILKREFKDMDKAKRETAGAK